MNPPHDETGSTPPDIPFNRASLWAGGWETKYARAGAGAPVVVLSGLPNPVAGPLANALSGAGHRVYAPEAPTRLNQALREGGGGRGGAPAFASWLRDFIDGVGLVEVPLVVADERLTAAALAFAVAHPCRITRLVLLFGGAADDGAVGPGGHAQRDRLEGGGQPLLVRAVAWPQAPEDVPAYARELTAEVSAFLHGAGATTGAGNAGDAEAGTVSRSPGVL